MSRTQHILPTGIVAAVALWVTWISYTAQPSEAFLFPRLIATVFSVLALWTFGKALLGKSRVGDGLSWEMTRAIAPGLIVMVIYVFWAAKGLGFYTATTIAFFVLLSLYDPASHRDAKSWLRRALITAGFIIVMYVLFAQVLNVFTPKEVLFN